MTRAGFIFTFLWLAASCAAVTAASPAELLEQLKSDDVEKQSQALAEIAKLGPYAGETIPAIVPLLSNADLGVQHEALLALAEMGPAAAPAVPALEKLLDPKTPLLAYESLRCAGAIGSGAAGLAPKVTALLQGEEPLLKVAAARALIAIQGQNQETLKQAVPVLIEGLESDVPLIQQEATLGLAGLDAALVGKIVEFLNPADARKCVLAARTLGLMGPKAQTAVPELLKLVVHENPAIAVPAIESLGLIGARDEATVAALTKALSSKEPGVQFAAAQALGYLGDASVPAVESLIKLLGSEDAKLRTQVAQTLGLIGPPAAAAVDALGKALSEGPGPVTIEAAHALGSIGKPAVPVLVNTLKNKPLQQLAVSVLGQIGPDAAPAVPELLKLLGSKEDVLRREVYLTLNAIGSEEAAASLLDRLKAESRPLDKVGQIYVLTNLGNQEALNTVKAVALTTEHPFLKLVSSWSLVKFDPKNTEVIRKAMPGLRSGLTDENPIVQREVAALVAEIGEPARAAIPELLKTVNNADPEVAAASLAALLAVKYDSAKLIPLAVTKLGDRDPVVRQTALFVLGSMGTAAKGARENVTARLKSAFPLEKMVASWATLNIAPDSPARAEAITNLVKGLPSAPPQGQVQIIELLGKVAKDDPAVQEAIKGQLESADEAVKAAAEKAIGG